MRLTSLDSTLLSQDVLTATRNQLTSYLQHLQTVSQDGSYTQPEASLHLPFDEAFIEKARVVTDEMISRPLKYVVVIGIGGSNLGAMAVYEALRGTHTAYTETYPHLLFLDTVSPEKQRAIRDALLSCASEEEFLLITISKSGGTTETLANTEALLGSVTGEFPEALKRLVVITDEGSKLWEAAEEKELNKLSIPKHVGGRYSIFSTVGLFPLLVAGFDVESMLEGAKHALHDCLETSEKNPALVSAVSTFFHLQNKKPIHNSFFFNPELESVGRWYRQLMGESLGKEQDVEGNVVHAGITPIVSIGSTDLHSMAQLYFGGPRDKFTNIISAPWKDQADVPNQLVFPGLVDDIQAKPLQTIMDAIVGGVKAAYRQAGLPFLTIELESLSEKELGYYLQFRMVEMMLLAKLMNVNAFDQPNVEAYKTAMRRLM